MQPLPKTTPTRRDHVAELLTTGILRVLASRALGSRQADGASRSALIGATPASGRRAA